MHGKPFVQFNRKRNLKTDDTFFSSKSDIVSWFRFLDFQIKHFERVENRDRDSERDRETERQRIWLHFEFFWSHFLPNVNKCSFHKKRNISEIVVNCRNQHFNLNVV